MEEKTLTIFAGINGAGKSSLYKMLNTDNTGVRIDPDEILAASGCSWENFRKQIDNAKYVIDLQDKCLLNGISINTETTLSGYKILKLAQKAKKLGYKIHLIYVGVDSLETAKQRVLSRVAKGGHGVPEKTIESRYRVQPKYFAEIIKMCDAVEIYDNTLFPHPVAHMAEGQIVRQGECTWLNYLVSQMDENVEKERQDEKE